MNKNKKVIDLPTKNTILFISNNIFNYDFSSNLTKKKLLKKLNELYLDKDNLYKLIEVMSTSSYKKLETIYNDYINGYDIYKSIENNEASDLIDLGIISLEKEKDINNDFIFSYNFDENTFNNLKYLFDEKGKELYEKEVLFENVIKGIFNIYGVVKMDFFVSLVNNYLNTNYDEESLIDRLINKLEYNQKVNRFTINWRNINETDTFITFLEYDDEMGLMCESQKQVKFSYNIYDLEEVIKRADKKYDDYTYEVINTIKEKNKKVKDEEIEEFVFNSIKGNEKALSQINEIIKDINDEDKEDILEMLASWHNTIGLYPLCGYSIESLNDENFVS